MSVYGGDVGLDEFAKHPNAELLWETAQGRVTWGYDMAVWSSHDGEDTLFNEFVQEARAVQSLRAEVQGEPLFPALSPSEPSEGARVGERGPFVAPAWSPVSPSHEAKQKQ